MTKKILLSRSGTVPVSTFYNKHLSVLTGRLVVVKTEIVIWQLLYFLLTISFGTFERKCTSRLNIRSQGMLTPPVIQKMYRRQLESRQVQ